MQPDTQQQVNDSFAIRILRFRQIFNTLIVFSVSPSLCGKRTLWN
jgi:hypothetical protein